MSQMVIIAGSRNWCLLWGHIEMMGSHTGVDRAFLGSFLPPGVDSRGTETHTIMAYTTRSWLGRPLWS